MPTRRQFLFTGVAAAAGIATLGTDGYLESYRLQLKRVAIPLRRLPHQFDGFTIVQLSDFHYEEKFSAVPIRRSVDLVNSLHPDLVVFTGDFVTAPMFRFGRHAALMAANAVFPCAALLSGIKAPMGSLAVLGNHDAYSNPALVASGLRSHGIPLLKNSCVPIERGGARLWLAGIDDALEGQPDLGAAIEKIPAGEPIILLAHEPDFADEAALRPVDLQLSGHSHGGQIWIPGIGAPWLPSLARNYPRGLYKIENMALYTNIGIGTIRAPIRINCIPEVTHITLRAM
ncbi:MAG TPA: metallophosphoesterase [Terriglobales bacterium]|nr:metallophosphoesterase [Terriglobales bacterium]